MEKGYCTAYRRSPGSTLGIRTSQWGSTIALLSRRWTRDRRTISWSGSSKSWAPKDFCACMNGRSGRGKYSGERWPSPFPDCSKHCPSLAQVSGCLRTGTDSVWEVVWFWGNSGTKAEHQQGKHRSRVIQQDCTWGSPGLTTAVHKQQGRCLFSREWDQFLPDICQEAFPHKYARKLNGQYSFPHSPADKFAKQFHPTPTPK